MALSVLAALGSIFWTLSDGFGLGSATFGAFALHPALMAVAFLFLAPLATIMYAAEGAVGIDHATAKLAHSTLHGAALALGCLGTGSMWVTHAGKSHFQTAHSWIGIGILAAFALQWSAGLFMFCVAPKAKRGAFVAIHAFWGMVVVFGALVTVLLGLLALVGKSTETGGSTQHSAWLSGNLASVFVSTVVVGLALVLYSRERAPQARQDEGDPFIERRRVL